MAKKRSERMPHPDQLLLSGGELAALLGCERAKVYALRDSGLIPAPINAPTHRHPQWRRQEVESWLAAGCPERTYWAWEPAMPATLDQMIKQRKRELIALDAEVKELSQQVHEARQLLERSERMKT